LRSVDGGGALLVNKESHYDESNSDNENNVEKTQICSKKPKIFNLSTDNSSTSSMIESDDSSEHLSQKQTRRKRRRKIRGSKVNKTNVSTGRFCLIITFMAIHRDPGNMFAMRQTFREYV